jgi:hypothetical protein
MLNTTAISSGTVAVESDAPAINGGEAAPLALPAPMPDFPVIDGVFSVVRTGASLPLPAPAEPAAPARPFAAKAAKLAAKRNAPKPAEPAAAPKPAKAAKAAKPETAAKPAAPVAPVKPSDIDRAKARESLAAARELSRAAVLKFYNGASAPFKAAGVKLRPLNGGSTVCGITARQSALLLALATYGAKAFRPDGSFQRDAFRVPAKLLNPASPSDVFVSAQPESGCVSDGRGVRFHFSGEAAYSPSTIIRVDYAGARACILATHGQRYADAFRDLLASYGVLAALRADTAIGAAQPVKRATKAA